MPFVPEPLATGVCATVQLAPRSSERKTRPAVVPNHARPPWLVMHSPLAAKAASPGRAAGICRPVDVPVQAAVVGREHEEVLAVGRVGQEQAAAVR